MSIERQSSFTNWITATIIVGFPLEITRPYSSYQIICLSLTFDPIDVIWNTILLTATFPDIRQLFSQGYIVNCPRHFRMHTRPKLRIAAIIMTNTCVRWCRDGQKEMTSIDFIRVLKSYYPIIRAADDKGAIYPALNLASVSLGARKLLHSCE